MDTYTLGALVPLTFAVYDPDGDYVAPDSATLTVTLPDGTTTSPTLVNDDTGIYTYDYPTVQVGPHSAVFVATGANGGTIEDVWLVTATGLTVVTVDDVRGYLGDTSASDDTLAGVLAAEQAAQAARCRLDPTNADLREALLRRCARNLAARSVPVASFTSFEGGATSTRVPTSDPEIARLEAPYKRLPVG